MTLPRTDPVMRFRRSWLSVPIWKVLSFRESISTHAKSWRAPAPGLERRTPKLKSGVRLDRRVVDRMGESDRDLDSMRCLHDFAGDHVDCGVVAVVAGRVGSVCNHHVTRRSSRGSGVTRCLACRVAFAASTTGRGERECDHAKPRSTICPHGGIIRRATTRFGFRTQQPARSGLSITGAAGR